MRRRVTIAALLALILTAIVPARARAADSPEYEVKAAFLYNFAKFVEWPPSSFEGPGAPLVICVLGRDPFGHTLDDVVQDERVNGRPLAVARPADPSAAKGCHILFVSASEQARFAQILAQIDRLRTLTVGDAPDFIQAGGHVRFFLAGNHVRFEIDAERAEKAQFRISSKLMRVARVISRSKGA